MRLRGWGDIEELYDVERIKKRQQLEVFCVQVEGFLYFIVLCSENIFIWGKQEFVWSNSLC